MALFMGTNNKKQKRLYVCIHMAQQSGLNVCRIDKEDGQYWHHKQTFFFNKIFLLITYCRDAIKKCLAIIYFLMQFLCIFNAFCVDPDLKMDRCGHLVMAAHAFHLNFITLFHGHIIIQVDIIIKQHIKLMKMMPFRIQMIRKRKSNHRLSCTEWCNNIADCSYCHACVH